MLRKLFKLGKSEIECTRAHQKFKSKVKNLVHSAQGVEEVLDSKRMVVMLNFYLDNLAEAEKQGILDRFSYEKVFNFIYFEDKDNSIIQPSTRLTQQFHHNVNKPLKYSIKHENILRKSYTKTMRRASQKISQDLKTVLFNLQTTSEYSKHLIHPSSINHQPQESKKINSKITGNNMRMNFVSNLAMTMKRKSTSSKYLFRSSILLHRTYRNSLNLTARLLN